MAGVKIAEAFVEFVARRGRKFDETVKEVKKQTAEAAKSATKTAETGKTAATAWAEMAGGMGEVAPVAAGAAAALGPVAAGIAAVAGALVLVGKLLPTLKQAADEAKNLRVLADVSGYSAAELSSMAFAMEHAGASLNDFLALRQGWNAQALDIQFGAGRAGSALRVLGVRATDETGRLRELADVLPEISKAMKEFDAPDRQRLADALFGGGGDTFLRMLAQGEDSLKQMKLDARALGLQSNEATINAGAQVSDTWNTLLDELKALWKNIVAVASPLLVPLLTLLISLLGLLNMILSMVNATIVRPITWLFGQIYKAFQYINRVVDKMHNTFSWMKPIVNFLFGGSSKEDEASRKLGTGQLSAIGGGGFRAELTGLTDFARAMITTAAGRANVGERQLAEMQKQTALLGTIAGSPIGTAPAYGV